MRRLIVGLVFGMSVLCGCSKYERIVPEELLVEKNVLQYENGQGKPLRVSPSACIRMEIKKRISAMSTANSMAASLFMTKKEMFR